MNNGYFTTRWNERIHEVSENVTSLIVTNGALPSKMFVLWKWCVLPYS